MVLRFVIVAILLLDPLASGAIAFRTVALSGQEAPGTEGGVFERFFSVPAMNESGQTAFLALLEVGTGDVDGSNDSGIWSEGSGALGLVAREGSEAPGTGGAVFGNLSGPAFNNEGQTAFFSGFFGSSRGEGIWSEAGGELGLVARTGGEAPGTDGGVFDTVALPDFNDAGQTAFSAIAEAGTGDVELENDNGIWSEGSGSLQLIAREGSEAPGSDGRTFQEFVEDSRPILSESGAVAFGASLGPDGSGVWSDRSGALDAVSVSGDPAPGTDGETFTGYQPATLAVDDEGALAFVGSRTTDSGEPFCCQGLWSEGGGSLESVAQEGEEAPGTGGGTYGGDSLPFSFRESDLNEAGQIAFTALTSTEGGEDRAGVFGPDGAGGVTLFFQEGETLPDLPAGLLLSDLFLRPEIDAGGGLTVLANLEDGTGEAAGFAILYALDPDRRFVVVATGDELEGQVVDFLDKAGFLNAYRGLNDAREIAFLAEFVGGGGGIFVATVPEPGTALLLAAGLAALARCRGRRRG